MKPLTLAWHVQHVQPIKILICCRCILAPDNLTSRQKPNMNTKVSKTVWLNGETLITFSRRPMRLIIIFVPLVSCAGPEQKPHIMFLYSGCPSELVCSSFLSWPTVLCYMSRCGFPQPDHHCVCGITMQTVANVAYYGWSTAMK